MFISKEVLFFAFCELLAAVLRAFVLKTTENQKLMASFIIHTQISCQKSFVLRTLNFTIDHSSPENLEHPKLTDIVYHDPWSFQFFYSFFTFKNA